MDPRTRALGHAGRAVPGAEPAAARPVAERPNLRLRRPQDLIEAVPYLLGFHPSDSVVLVGLGPPGHGRRRPTANDRADAVPPSLDEPPPSPVGPQAMGRVQITARMDIADLCRPPAFPAVTGGPGSIAGPTTPGSPAGPAPAEFATDDLAAGAADALRRAGARTAIGLVFAAADTPPPRTAEAMRCAGSACERAGLAMFDWLVVPPQAAPRPGAVGLPVNAPSGPVGGSRTGPTPPSAARATPGGSVVAAEATYAGLVARPDRDAVVRLLEPEPVEHRSTLGPALAAAQAAWTAASGPGRAQSQRRRSIRHLFAATRVRGLVSDVALVGHGAALADIEVRDACWLAVERGRIDGEDLWRELARRLPAPYDAAPLFLFGWLRWRAGDGVLAGIAAGKALDSDPGYRAAHLLDGALRTGLDPFRTPRLRKGA